MEINTLCDLSNICCLFVDSGIRSVLFAELYVANRIIYFRSIFNACILAVALCLIYDINFKKKQADEFMHNLSNHLIS